MSTTALFMSWRKIRERSTLLRLFFVFADKARYIYEMDAIAYKKLFTENVTKTYKHAQDDIKNEIN